MRTKKNNIQQEDKIIKINKLSEKDINNFEIESIEILLKKTLFLWKKNLENKNIKTDTIGDLEKLIKLRLLLVEEKEKRKAFCEKVINEVIMIIKDEIEEYDLKIKILERLQNIEIINNPEKYHS
ncbi:MAG TPA: hypothetical protein VIR55_10430 [Ignavibacteria bacterium]